MFFVTLDRKLDKRFTNLRRKEKRGHQFVSATRNFSKLFENYMLYKHLERANLLSAAPKFFP